MNTISSNLNEDPLPLESDSNHVIKDKYISTAKKDDIQQNASEVQDSEVTSSFEKNKDDNVNQSPNTGNVKTNDHMPNPASSDEGSDNAKPFINNMAQESPELPLTKVKNNKVRRSFLLSLAYYKNESKIQIRDNDYTTDYSKRLASETPQDAMSISIKYYRGIAPNLSLGLGLGFLKIWDKVNYVESSVEYVQNNNVITDRLVTENGTIETLGSQTVKRTSTQNIIGFNKYQYWCLPVDILYQLKNKKITYEFGTGVDLTLHRSFKGKIIHQDTNYDLSTDQQQIIAHDLDLRFNAILGISYQVTSASNFVLRSKYILPSRSIFKSNYGLSQYQNLLGIESGFNYIF